MPPLPADFVHIKVCKPNVRKTLDTTLITYIPWLCCFHYIKTDEINQVHKKDLLQLNKSFCSL